MAGSKTKGTDGVIAITSGANPVSEIPCLVSWELSAGADFQKESQRCMKSNGDGGSSAAVPWDTNELQGKNWRVRAEFFWQATDEGASPYLDLDQVGEEVTVELYPNDNVSGQKEYTGTGKIESVNLPSEVTTNMRVTVELVGDGAITINTVV